MDDMQWLSLLLVCSLSLVGLWLVFIAVPGLVWTVLTVRLRDVHRQLVRLLDEDAQLRELEAIQEFDHFLHMAIGNRTHFGLSGALTSLTAAALVDLGHHSEPDVLEGMTYTQRLAVISLVADTLRLSLIRAFLGSAIWFLTFPLAVWAGRRFSRVEAADEDWNTTTLIVPIESWRERADEAWSAGLSDANRRHQPAG